LLSSPSAHPLPLHSFPTRRSSDLTSALANSGSIAGRCSTGAEFFSFALFAVPPWVCVPPARFIALRICFAKCRWHLRGGEADARDRKSTRLNSSHVSISYAVFCLK